MYVEHPLFYIQNCFQFELTRLSSPEQYIVLIKSQWLSGEL